MPRPPPRPPLFPYTTLFRSRPAPAAARKASDPRDRDEPSLDTLVPANPNKPYDMKELIGKVVDDGDFFELQPNYAGNIDRKSTRLNSSHSQISYAVFCLKKK